MILSRRTIIGGSIVLLLAALALVWAMRGKSVVDQYVADLHAKGERIYFTDPPYPKMTNGTPGMDKLVSAADKIGGSLPIQLARMTNAGEMEIAWAQKEPRIDGATSKYRNWSQVDAFVQTNGQALGEIRDSLKDPEPDLGWQTNIFTFRRTFVEQRNASYALAVAVIDALHEKENATALTNLLPLIQMSKLERGELTLVAQMVRISEAGVGLNTTWQALQAPGWTDEQLKKMQSAWEGVDLMGALETGFTGERLHAYAHIQWVRKTGTNVFNWSIRGGPAPLSDRIRTRLWRATVADQDEMFYLGTMQRFVEHGRLARQGRPLYEVEQLFDGDSKEVQKKFGERFAFFRYPLSAISIPNFTRCFEYCIHDEVQRRLTLAAIALTRYQIKYGKPPSTLGALVPEFCSEVPLDPMDLKPLRYRVNADGTFLLYSIGDNGKDDGGNPQAPAPSRETNLFSGLDIVWPRAARTNN